MITTGSVRGKCEVPQAGHLRCQPSSAQSLGWPQAAQNRCDRCQLNSARAVPASAAPAGSTRISAWRRSMKR
jgi:hypothetical protein